MQETLFDNNVLLATMDAFGMMEASSGSSGSAFVRKLLRRRQANADGATSNGCNLSFKLARVLLLSVVFSYLASMRPLSADQCLPSPKTARRLRPLSK